MRKVDKVILNFFVFALRLHQLCKKNSILQMILMMIVLIRSNPMACLISNNVIQNGNVFHMLVIQESAAAPNQSAQMKKWITTFASLVVALSTLQCFSTFMATRYAYKFKLEVRVNFNLRYNMNLDCNNLKKYVDIILDFNVVEQNDASMFLKIQPFGLLSEAH